MSTFVAYGPWLTQNVDAVLASNTGYLGFEPPWRLKAGWNTLSTPVFLDPQAMALADIIANIDAVEQAWAFDAAAQTWVIAGSDYVLQPGDALMVKISESLRLRILPSASLTGPPLSPLVGGWNLVGFATPLVQEAGQEGWPDSPFPGGALLDFYYRVAGFIPYPVGDALASLEWAGDTSTPGYTIVASPSVNVASWAYSRGSSTLTYAVGPFEGYWVLMDNPDDLGGFNTTPIALPPWSPDPE